MIGFKRVSGFKKYLIDMTTPKVPDDAIVSHVKNVSAEKFGSGVNA
jgi:hypothetical protein